MRNTIVIFIIFVIMLLSLNLCGQTSTNWIMYNDDFTNVNLFDRARFHEVFKGEYTRYQINYAFTVFSNHGLDPLVFMLLAYKEGMPVTNFLLGCGIHLQRPGYKYFEQQVCAAANTLRYWFDNAKANNYTVYLLDQKRYLVCFNRASFSLFKYTPVWKQFWKRKNYYVGNWVVKSIWETLYYRMVGSRELEE